MTYTYVNMPLSRAAFDEIVGKLKDAGYDHVFKFDDTGQVVLADMTHIAVTIDE